MAGGLTRRVFAAGACYAALALAGCAAGTGFPGSSRESGSAALASESGDARTGGSFGADPREVEGYAFTEGLREDRDFTVDDALQTPDGRILHFSLRVPSGYDGSTPHALYVACPGWEGLYFQGVGANLQEDYPFVANGYIPDLIVASPQLDDWGEQSAADVVELTEWLLAAFNIDASKVYLSGCSGGGETISLVLGERPDLFRRALHTISRWEGDPAVLAEAEVPVYIAIGEHDDYYGSAPAQEGAERIRAAYRARGITEERIDELVVLDVKPTSYFVEHGFDVDASQHAAGGYLFAHDEEIMGWLFR